MRILVFGGRSFANRDKLFWAMTQYASSATLIIHGACRTGADKMADEWARERGMPVERFIAEWARFEKDAGPLRNAEMLSCGRPDFAIGFSGGRGTRDMAAKCETEDRRRRMCNEGCLPLVRIA